MRDDAGPGERLHDALDRQSDLTRHRTRRGLRHDAADDASGTIETDDAIGFDPTPVLRSLSEHGAPAVVMGQVAGILHGSTELTGDLDLLWSGAAKDATAMREAFVALGAELTDDGGAPVDATDAFGLSKTLFRTPTAAGDCCTPRLDWKGLDVVAFLDRADGAEIDGSVVRYLTIEDLIAMRRAAGRPKDFRRVAELERLLADHRVG